MPVVCVVKLWLQFCRIPPKSCQTVRKSMKQCSCLTIELKMSGTTLSRFSQEVVSHGSEKVVLFLFGKQGNVSSAASRPLSLLTIRKLSFWMSSYEWWVCCTQWSFVYYLAVLTELFMFFSRSLKENDVNVSLKFPIDSWFFCVNEVTT